uniref:WAP domain-containing protein n=1 Tax=Varanus komodoensis TaxID=61221 RepID=A0A8D2L095_VARKO
PRASRPCAAAALLGPPIRVAMPPPLRDTFCVAEKPGNCPRVPPGFSIPCHVECHVDWDCPGPEKCCHLGCRSVCYSSTCGVGTKGQACKEACQKGSPVLVTPSMGQTSRPAGQRLPHRPVRSLGWGG